MMVCDGCQVLYPEELLNPMFDSKVGYTKPICGICALDMSNEALGIKRQKFQGVMAEDLRQRAIRWRRQHGQKS